MLARAESAEDEEGRPGRGWANARGGNSRHAEDQHRHVKRQNEQRQQHAASPKPEGEARTDCRDEAHGRHAGKHGSTSSGIGVDRQIEQEPENGREKSERNAGRHPMGKALQRGDKLERQWPGGEHIQRAVLIVVVKDAVGGEQARK